METKDLVLLMLIPIILISLVIYTNSPAITGAILYQPGLKTTEQEESNIIGTYSIMPSFKAKINYDLQNEYGQIKQKLDNIIKECINNPDIGQCLDDKAKDWRCVELKDEATAILYDFVDKFNECLSLKEDGVVCKFSLDDRELINRPIKSFDIVLTNENQRIKADLVENAQILKTEYIDQEGLFYIDDYDTKDVISNSVEQIKFRIDFEVKKPIVKQAVARYTSNNIELSKMFILYKVNDGIKFIDATQEGNFRTGIPANKIIDLPKIKGIKFCAKTSQQFPIYDSSDNTVKLRDVVYKFAVTYPKQSVPPKPIENLEVLDALKAENSVILTWDKSNEPIKSFSIYYSTKDFVGTKVEGIKKDSSINKKSVQNSPIEVKDIDLQKCDFSPIGEPCKYAIYNKKLEPDKLYYWSSKNKYIYLINDVKDNIEYNFAVTAVNEEGIELNNDKSIKDNIYVLTLDKNYKKFTSKDDLAPDKVMSLTQNTEIGKIKLTWIRPLKNIDGSASVDVNSFNIYYKKTQPSLIPAERIDNTYTKNPVKASEANCDVLVKTTACEYSLGSEKNQLYSIAVTAVDKNSNEFTDNADVIQASVS